MAPLRIKTVITCLLALCFARAARGTGGWDEDEPATLLNQSLASLPAKSLGQIFFETSPKNPDVEAPDYPAEIAKISARIGKDKPDDLAKEVDGLLEKARLNYEDGDWCNFLQDMRDVVSSSAGKGAGQAQAYIKWRLGNKGWFGFQPKQQDDANSADDSDATKQKPAAPDPREVELERLTNAATGPIKAHWLYLRGALLYSGGDRTECKDWFARVVKEFPDSPRAEFAQFMIARSDLSAARNTDYSAAPEKAQAALANAKKEFMEFHRKYPGGRLDTDALGWLGGIEFEDGDSLEALQCFIMQAEDEKHPEVRKSAVFMCEDTLANLKPDADNSAVYALLARHPQVAMAYIYQVVNVGATATDDSPNESDKIKKWRTNVLPLVAAEVAKQHDLYKADAWQPRYLAMMAQAACDAGDADKALEITGVAADQINHSDDLLLARALALQQADRPREAIDVYRTLVKNFPKGALTNGARLRLALALQDDHQAGAAIVELRSLRAVEGIGTTQSTTGFLYPDSYTGLDPTDSGIDPNVSGVYVDQIDQMIDTLLNFAPVPELAVALDSPALDAPAKSELRAVLAERCLVAENFAGAKKYMTPAQYGLIAANLEKLTQEATGGRDAKARAAGFAKVGDAWAQARERLLRLPLADNHGTNAISGNKDVYYDMPGEVGRRTNGTALGFKDVDSELEDRDELRHASRWWMRAAREDPGTPLAAGARWKALEAMPVIASASIYTETRAREINMKEVSREIYNKLRSESPDSIEAKRYAAYWSIPGPQKDEQGNEIVVSDSGPFGEGSDNAEINQMGYEYSDYDAFSVSSDISNGGQNNGVWQEVAARIGKMRDNARKWDVARMGKDIDELAGMARNDCSSIEELTCLNFLDDLALFTREKGVTPEMLRAYLDIRLAVLGRTNWPGSPMASDNGGDDNVDSSKADDAVLKQIEGALNDPAMKPVDDYLECARIGMIAAEQTEVETSEPDYKADDGGGDNNGTTTDTGHYSYPSRDFAKMEKLCREFLKKYPASHKREAVAFVLARSVVSLSKPHIAYVGKPLPGSNPKDGSFMDVKKVFRAEPFSAKRILDVLDAYDHEFPKGRYAADIRDYRAYVAWQTRDWGGALDLTLAELADDSNAVLQGEAALRLANIFGELKQAQERADLLDAIRQRPAAKERLKQYVATIPKDMSHPLRYMQAYLTDQLAAAGK